MSQWRQTWDLIRREFVQRAKSRGFQIMMLVTVGLVMSIIPLMAIALGDPPPTRIGVTSAVPDGTEGALQQRAAELDVAVIVRSYSSESTAETALRDGDVQVVYTGSAIVFLEEESTTAKAVVTGAAALLAFRAAANALGIPEAELAQVLAPPELEATILSPPDPEEEPRRIGSLVGLILLYMSILIFGQFVALGVMEEKQSRVVEVVLSRVAPDQVLIAKVVGIGALGLVQIAALGGAIWLALSFVDIADVSLPVLGAEILASVVFWFLVGYTMYAVLYAALGATVSRQEDLQSVLMLPVVLLLPGFFLGQTAQVFPDMPLVVIASLVPLWSPMVMPVRAAVSNVPLWELALAVLLVAATSYAAVRIGSRLYRGAVLRLGAKVRLRDAWRATW
ncbi:MAG TPA: ABC transporter permease [Acidimicrobiia bacterium]|nr:ABC transporter permease [Acidimicrobiia bacterium]